MRNKFDKKRGSWRDRDWDFERFSQTILRNTATWAMLVVSTSYLSGCAMVVVTNDQDPLPLPGASEGDLVITGQVSLDTETMNEILNLDPNAKPLGGWSVRLASVLGSPTIYANNSVLISFTDDEGNFTISGIPNASYRVIAIPPAEFVPLSDSDVDSDEVIDGSSLSYLSSGGSTHLSFEFTKRIPVTTLPPNCSAPACFKISGTVYMNKPDDAVPALDTNDGILANILVELHYGVWATRVEGTRVLDADGYPVRTVTDSHGRYEFKVSPDSYKVVVIPEVEQIVFNWERAPETRMDGATNITISNANIENVNFGIKDNSNLDSHVSETYATTIAPEPTTPEPTTPEPTTPEPTTPEPTTEAPTTEAPTTPGPTTEAPTTEAPTTPGPTTEAPTTEAPTTPGPTTEAPTTEAPTTPGPTTEAPTTEAPTTPGPTTEAPTTEAPTTPGPTTPDPFNP